MSLRRAVSRTATRSARCAFASAAGGGSECICGLPACLPALCPALYAGGWSAPPAGDSLLAPYQGSAPACVAAAFELARLRPGESLLDIGAGDGRIMAAALAAGAARVTGYELQPEVHALGEAALDAALGGPSTALRARASLLLGDVREQRLPRAGVDVITLFLLPKGLALLAPWLAGQLEPATAAAAAAAAVATEEEAAAAAAGSALQAAPPQAAAASRPGEAASRDGGGDRVRMVTIGWTLPPPWTADEVRSLPASGTKLHLYRCTRRHEGPEVLVN